MINLPTTEDKNVFFVAPEIIPDASFDSITTVSESSEIATEPDTGKTDEDLSNEIK